MIKAYRLYTGTDGHSYVEKGMVDEDSLHPATSIRYKESAPHSVYDWHTAPVLQYVVTIRGMLEFTTSAGEVFVIQAGDILIASDITGKGHKWRLLGDEPWQRVYVTFENAAEANFLLVDALPGEPVA